MTTEAWIWMGAWALVLLVVVWLLVREPQHAEPRDPVSILRDRFARGELSEEEFTRAIGTLDERPGAHVRPLDSPTRGQDGPHD